MTELQEMLTYVIDYQDDLFNENNLLSLCKMKMSLAALRFTQDMVKLMYIGNDKEMKDLIAQLAEPIGRLDELSKEIEQCIYGAIHEAKTGKSEEK